MIFTTSQEDNGFIFTALLAGIVSILLGVYFIKRPEQTWKHKHQRFSRGGKPSKYYIEVQKARGVFAIVMGTLTIALAIALIINIFWPIFG